MCATEDNDDKNNETGLERTPPSGSADAEAEFVCLLTGMQSELRGFIAHLTPYHGTHADILQEVNLLVWQKRHQFQPGSNFRAWVYTFARNVTMKHQKRARRENELMFSAETIEALANDYAAADPVFDDRLPALRRCLEKVPEPERSLLLNRYRRHGAVAQAAKLSTKSEAALRGVLFRLRIALRRCVEREMNAVFSGA
jgi:RNA polymerase sigma-70 factor, ECF subfamily